MLTGSRAKRSFERFMMILTAFIAVAGTEAEGAD